MEGHPGQAHCLRRDHRERGGKRWEGGTHGTIIGGGDWVHDADLLGLSPEDRRKAVAVGIGGAGGIGTIFKTPIGGGAILAAEILYRRDLETDVIYPSIIAAAVGYSIFGSVVGGFTPIFGNYLGAFNPFRLPLYAVLGLVAGGGVGLLYIKSFYGIQRAFRKAALSPYLKPVIGGAGGLG